jgi:hypothetical protein
VARPILSLGVYKPWNEGLSRDDKSLKCDTPDGWMETVGGSSLRPPTAQREALFEHLDFLVEQLALHDHLAHRALKVCDLLILAVSLPGP